MEPPRGEVKEGEGEERVELKKKTGLAWARQFALSKFSMGNNLLENWLIEHKLYSIGLSIHS
jgi:hypothetical protein